MAVLAGDVGGTKTDMAIFSSDAGVRAPLARATFQNHRYASLEAIALEFLGQTKVPVVAATFDVAGPVVDGEAKITNLPWVVTEASLKDALQLTSVHLLNDLGATALAVPMLDAAELRTLNGGRGAT